MSPSPHVLVRPTLQSPHCLALCFFHAPSVLHLRHHQSCHSFHSDVSPPLCLAPCLGQCSLSSFRLLLVSDGHSYLLTSGLFVFKLYWNSSENNRTFTRIFSSLLCAIAVSFPSSSPSRHWLRAAVPSSLDLAKIVSFQVSLHLFSYFQNPICLMFSLQVLASSETDPGYSCSLSTSNATSPQKSSKRNGCCTGT